MEPAGPVATALWRPGAVPVRPAGGLARGSRLAVLGAVGVAALVTWHSLGAAAFVGVPQQHRPAGHVVVVEHLPRGAVCRAAYGEDNDRREWNPFPQWRGEKTFHPNKALQADENRQWYHFNAEGKVLGHLAQVVAHTLRGKDSPLYDPTRDVGAFVVVTNCEKVRVSGKKYHYKLYFRNLSFRPGHMKVERFKDLQKRFPERIIMRAVWGSMPKTPSCRRIFKDRLKLFTGPNHLYYHENPVEWPMHTVKDCTPTQNLAKRDRNGNWFQGIPKALVREKARKDFEDKKLLYKYKKFLENQYEQEGEEAAARMAVDELAYRGERARMDKVRDENVGIPTPKKEIHMYLGLNLPKKRISGNRR
mmetsp:Transcript_72617/g.200362  ORF Transcript_72617/g.200362 Transcript_72617/m.200362 type:complete len:362 (-) Transcript_72617:69-1154(-)